MLFISSYVNNSEKQELPNGFKESMTLKFDIIQKKVLLKSLNIYPADNIYLKYAREAATRTSFDSIFLNNETEKTKVKNFYGFTSPWYEYKYLNELEMQVKNNGEDIYNVIYMLYNKNDKSIYVGKAERLITRLKQHEDNLSLSEPMSKFTHFRYSVIAEGYEDYIYIIENSAIHDLAYIFNMPNAKTYCSPLSKICDDLLIQDVKMNNTAETQTKIRKKQI